MTRVLAGLVVALSLLVLPLHAANLIEITSASGAPGDTDAAVTIAFTSDSDMEGYSVALTYDPEFITCTEVTEIGDFGPDFFEYKIDDEEGTVVIGAILVLEPDSSETIPASPEEAVDMLELTFEVSEDAGPGDFIDLELADGVGTPPINNVFSVSGQDVGVEIASIPFEVENLNTYRFEDKVPKPGRAFVVGVLCSHPEDLEGFSVEISYDPDEVKVRDFETGSTEDLLADEVPDSSDIEFLDISIDNIDGMSSIACVFDSLPPFEDGKVLVAADDQEIVEIDFLPDTGLDDGDTFTVEFTQEDVGNLVTYRGGELAVQPVSTDGEFTLETPEELEFIRGDANGNGNVNIADGIYILAYRFIEGEPPPCEDSGDAQDDGRVDIADAIWVFKWQFTDGEEPAAPFPDCGVDSDEDDDLGCDETSPDCE